VFAKATDEYLRHQLKIQFNTIIRVASMTPKEQRDTAGKQSPPLESVFVNVIIFTLAFEEAQRRGLTTPAEDKFFEANFR
jgi:hypothetical protein